MIYTVTLNPAVDRELVVPAIEFDSVLRAVDWRVDCGGKGFNVSRQLMALGTPSIAVGFAGGRNGELLREGLHALGIQTDFVWVDGETRTNVSIVSQTQNHYVKANEPGPEIQAARQEALLEKIRSLAQPGDWWVLAGSLPPGVPEMSYAQIIANLKERHAKAILDTSGTALDHGCKASPHLVKPNAYEAQKLTGLPVNSPAEIAAAAAAILRMGPAHIVISLGKEGAMLLEEDQVWLARSPRIEERNPIGAGDSMVGGLVWGLHQNLGLREALRWGLACGAATASLSGTAVGTQALVETLLADVAIEPAGLGKIQPLSTNK
jgi:1-phosphofructokinase family hexose kinase